MMLDLNGDGLTNYGTINMTNGRVSTRSPIRMCSTALS